MADEVLPDPRIKEFEDAWTKKVDANIDEANAIRARSEDAMAKKAVQLNDMQYTMFVSGLTWGGRMNDLNDKTDPSDVGLVFDAVTETSYTKAFEKSKYSLESKAAASDHVQEQDGKFSFTGIVSDILTKDYPTNYLDQDTDRDNPMKSKRSTKALEILNQVAKDRNMVTLVTEDDILTGYVITSLQASRGGSDSSLTFQIEMEEFRRIAIGRTVLANVSPKKAKKKNGGAKQTAAGGAAEDDGVRKNPSPYIGKTEQDFNAIDKSFTGSNFGEPTSAPAQTIRPDGKFSPASLSRTP